MGFRTEIEFMVWMKDEVRPKCTIKDFIDFANPKDYKVVYYLRLKKIYFYIFEVTYMYAARKSLLTN